MTTLQSLLTLQSLQLSRSPPRLFTSMINIQDINPHPSDIESEYYETEYNKLSKEEIKKRKFHWLEWHIKENKSYRILDRFEISHYASCPSRLPFLHKYFVKHEIGRGSKFFLLDGEYIPKYFDAQLPDLNGLPHTHSIIIATVKDRVKFDEPIIEEKIKEERDFYDIALHSGMDCFIYLYSIDTAHSFTPVIKGEFQYFVFPVYGEYNPMENIKKSLSYQYTPVDIIDEVVDTFQKNYHYHCDGDNDKDTYLSMYRSLGLLKHYVREDNKFASLSDAMTAIDDYCVLHSIDISSKDECLDIPKYRIKNACGRINEYPEIETENPYITYKLYGQEMSVVLTDDYKLPSKAKCVVYHASKQLKCHKAIHYAKKILDEYVTSLKEELALRKKQEKEFKENIAVALPDTPFIYVCSKYYDFTKKEKPVLYGEDNKFLEYCQSLDKKVTKYLVSNKYKHELSIPMYYGASFAKIASMREMEKTGAYYKIDNVDIDRNNDPNNYYDDFEVPFHEKVYCCLLVE